MFVFRSPLVAVLISLMAQSALSEISCPPQPGAEIGGIEGEIKLSAGRLLGLTAGDLSIKYKREASELIHRLKATERGVVVGLLAATYCTMLRDSKLTDMAKLGLWGTFVDNVLNPRITPFVGGALASAPKVPTQSSVGSRSFNGYSYPGGRFVKCEVCWVEYKDASGSSPFAVFFEVRRDGEYMILLDASGRGDRAKTIVRLPLVGGSGYWSNELTSPNWTEIGIMKGR